MQQTLVSFLTIATAFFGATSAVPQPPGPALPPCVQECGRKSYPELATGCPDNDYLKCLCKDPSNYNDLRTCVSQCPDDDSKELAGMLPPDLCGASTTQQGGATGGGATGGSATDGGTVVTVTDTVTLPCSSDVVQPTPMPPPDDTHTEAPGQPPVETQPTVVPPVETQTLTGPPPPPPPPPTGTPTTGVIPVPGTNTTVTTGQPTQPTDQTTASTTVATVPTNDESTAGKFGVSFAMAAVVGIVGIFVSL